jgi:RNA polymerase sigma-70 factor (ECF subfamily)
MEHYAGGDAGAFEELFRRFEARAYSYFIKRTRSAERAQDLYQDLFLRIHRARDSYDPARAFAPWFFQIAHRLWVDDQRRAYRAHEVAIGDREPSAPDTGSGDEVADREQLGQILDSLSADERYVLVSAKLDGIGYAELAVHLGKSADAVKKMASRALQRLRAAPTPAIGAVQHSR